MSLKSKQKREHSYSSEFLILALSIDYVDEDELLAKLLCLSTNSHKVIKDKVYRHALLRCQPERLNVKRNALWLLILQTKKRTMDYYALKERVSLNRELISNVDEVILLDV